MIKVKIVFLFVSFCLFPSFIFAEETSKVPTFSNLDVINEVVFAEEKESKMPNLVGLGIGISESVYKGVDTSIYPLPIISWKQDNFFISGTKAGYIVKRFDDFSLSIYLTPHLMGYKDSDSDDLNGMDHRNGSLDGGIGIDYIAKQFFDIKFSTNVTFDLLSEYEGYEFKFGASKLFDFKPLFIKPSAGINWQSENTIDYYYGVRVDEITAVRSIYSGDSAFNYGFQLDFYFALSKEWMIISSVGVDFLGDEISDSPIVDESHTLSALIGIARMF